MRGARLYRVQGRDQEPGTGAGETAKQVTAGVGGADLLELGVELAFPVACDDAFEELRGGNAGCAAGGEEFA